VTIQLPPNLYDDSDWMEQESATNMIDALYIILASHYLICCLATNIDSIKPPPCLLLH
jgi:hypothetical protein